MFDTIAGLPIHPLVVHAVVVLAPLSALLAIVYAVKPAWRHGLRWPTVGLTAIAALSAVLATSSGDPLEARVNAGASPAARALVEQHAEAGDLAATTIYILLGAVVLSVFLLIPARRENLRKGLSGLGVALCLLAALGVGYGVFNAGHSGAKAAWSDTVQNTPTPTAGGDGD